MKPLSKLAIGKQAEQAARQFLHEKGLVFLTQNYRCYFGEIDLIMRDQKDIVFVEVRYRSRTDFGTASESINKKKQVKLYKTALHFLQKKDWLDKVNSRFDVMAIHALNGDWQFEWLKNAFSPAY